MTTAIAIPPSIDDVTFEQVLAQLAPLPVDARVLLDARHARWASPYGLAALLTLAQTRDTKPALAVPETEDTARYWARTAFFEHAADLFELHGQVPRTRPAGESQVLLEITPINQSIDVHSVVERIQQRSAAILQGQLKLDVKATIGFSLTLSEACQNVVEHAGRGGWVAVQAYNWQKRLGRHVVQIAVCDAGIGFRQSLEQAPNRRRSDRWDDGMALEDAVLRQVSRFRDPSRGQGLAGIRKSIAKWDGKLSIRSGTARIAVNIPTWDEDVPLIEKLAPFPGSQMQITIPERAPAP